MKNKTKREGGRGATEAVSALFIRTGSVGCGPFVAWLILPDCRVPHRILFLLFVLVWKPARTAARQCVPRNYTCLENNRSAALQLLSCLSKHAYFLWYQLPLTLSPPPLRVGPTNSRKKWTLGGDPSSPVFPELPSSQAGDILYQLHLPRSKAPPSPLFSSFRFPLLSSLFGIHPFSIKHFSHVSFVLLIHTSHLNALFALWSPSQIGSVSVHLKTRHEQHNNKSLHDGELPRPNKI